MVHAHNHVKTYETVFFHGVDDSNDGAGKHLTHLSQGVDCHLTQRSKGNEHVFGDTNNDVDNGVEDGDDGADKHLTHLSQG
eukprot:11477283-Ditylum_brightwellii.AAC.1